MPAVNSRRRSFSVLLVLIALCLAQSVAMVHALSHLGDRDLPNAPGQHTQVCTDCVSHAPLLVTGGATAGALLLALQAFFALQPRSGSAPAGRSAHPAFRSRAPPR